jgi:chromosome segregation ATPase
MATKKYSELKTSEKEIQAQYHIVCDNLDNVKKEYNEKLLAGIHGVEIKNLSTLVSELNGRKNELSIKLREVRDAIRDFEKDHNNIKLVPVIREKEFVEAKLSNIYNSLRDLKVKINRIKKQISDLEISLENYNSICEQIEHLEHELKN